LVNVISGFINLEYLKIKAKTTLVNPIKNSSRLARGVFRRKV